MKSVLLIAITLFCGSVMALNLEPPPEVMEIVKMEIAGKHFLSKWNTQSFRDEMNVDSTFTLSQVSVGPIFPIFWLKPEAIQGFQKGYPVDSLIKESIIWIMTVIYKGRCIAGINIEQTDSLKWEAVMEGIVPKDVGWMKVLSVWKQEDGYHPIFFTSRELQELYFYIPEKKTCNLTRYYFEERDCPSENTSKEYNILTSCDESIKHLKYQLELSKNSEGDLQ